MKHLLLILTLFSFVSLSGQELTPLKKGDKFAFFQGDERITDFLYEAVSSPFPIGYVVQANGVQGLVNQLGQEIIPLQYDYLAVAGENAIIASQNGRVGVLDALGNSLMPFEYEDIDQYSSSGTAVVKQNGKWGVLRNGKMSYNINNIIFKYPETQPLFVGSHKQRKSIQEKQQRSYTKLAEFIYTKFLTSETVISNKLSGSGTLAFIITAEGKVHSPWVEGTLDTAFANELVKVAGQLPDWSAPAMVGGIPVAMEFKIPLEMEINY